MNVCIKHNNVVLCIPDFSEETDVNKTSALKELDVCIYWYVLNFSFKLQPNVCNRCHDLLMRSVNLSDISI